MDERRVWREKQNIEEKRRTHRTWVRRVAILATAGIIHITGINLGFTLNPEAHKIYPTLPPRVPEVTETVRPTPAPTVKRDTKIGKPRQVEVPVTRKTLNGKWYKLLDRMDGEMITVVADAIRKSNSEVPNNRYEVYGISREYEESGDKEFLKKAFEVIDQRSSSADMYSLAYPMREISKAATKHILATSINESDKYPKIVNANDIDIYYSYGNGDTVKAYDVRTIKVKNGRREEDMLIGRKVHFKGTDFDTLITNSGILSRAMGKCAVGDQNHMIYESSQKLYKVLEKFLDKDTKIKVNSKGKGMYIKGDDIER